MAETLTQEQKVAHLQNAKLRLEDPAFYARLQQAGRDVNEKNAAEYLALGDTLMAIDEQRQDAAQGSIAAIHQDLRKKAAEQGYNLPGGAADQLDQSIRVFAATQIQNDNEIAGTLAQLIS